MGDTGLELDPGVTPARKPMFGAPGCSQFREIRSVTCHVGAVVRVGTTRPIVG